jgi:transmembrane sensor
MTRPPNDRRRDDAMVAEWIARIGDERREAEDEAFQAWLADRPERRAAYRAFVETRSMVDRTRLPVPPLHVTTSAAVRTALRPAAAVAIAASILLAFGVAWIVRGKDLVTPIEHAEGDRSGLRLVAFGGDRTMILDDGAAMRSDGGSAAGRIELLSGRARFAASADAVFIVATRDLRVSGRDAVFDIDVRGERTTVVVIAGRLIVVPAGRAPSPLAAHQMLTVASSRVTIVPAPRDGGDWTVAMLPIDDRTLGDIVAIVARRGGPKLILDDPALAGLQLQGQVRSLDIAALARQLAAALDLDVIPRGGDYVLKRK